MKARSVTKIIASKWIRFFLPNKKVLAVRAAFSFVVWTFAHRICYASVRKFIVVFYMTVHAAGERRESTPLLVFTLWCCFVSHAGR